MCLRTSAAFGLTLILATTTLPGSPGAFELDPRYLDADGDLVADLPSDESEWLSPGELIFAYTPAEDPSVYEEAWSDFMVHLSEVTGLPARYFIVQNNAAQIEAMRAGRLHIAGISTGAVPLAVACAGYHPFAMMAANDGSFGYRMAIITRADSGIAAVEDINGRTLAFTAETSNSGYKAPVALLQSEFAMEPGEDYAAAFSGAHDNSVLGVYNKDYDAAAIADGVLKRLVDRGMVEADAIATVYASAPFPTTSYGVAYNLHPDIQAKVKEAFFTFDWADTTLLAEFSQVEPPQESFKEISFADDWQIIRQIDATMGTSYSCN